MLKIDDSVRRKYIPSHVWTHLSTVSKDDVRNMIFFLVFFWMDLICVLTAIAEPFIKGYFIAVIIPTIIINLWAIAILVRNYYSTQMEVLYFFATVGFVGTFCMFMIAHKIAHYQGGLGALSTFSFFLLFYIGWFVYFAQYIVRKYKDMKWHLLKRKSILLDICGLIILITGGNGYNFYHFQVKGSPFEPHITAVIFLSVGILFIYIAVLFSHRILYIKANRKHFKLAQPTKKERKQSEVKGKEIIVR